MSNVDPNSLDRAMVTFQALNLSIGPLITPSEPTLPSFPIEIYHKILSLLSKLELIPCLTVSRRFHSVAEPILCLYLYANIHIDITKDIWVSLITTEPSYIPSHPPFPLLGTSTSSIAADGSLASVKTSIVAGPTLPRFDYTTHLTLTSHSAALCASLPPLIMPNLVTLHISPNGDGDHLDLCSGSSGACCPLISAIRPARLIIGGCSTGLSGTANGLWSSLIPFPPYIEELIVLVGLFTGIEQGSQTIPAFFEQLPEGLEKVTFVMTSGDECWDKVYDQTGFTHHLDQQDRVYQKIITACVGRADAVEIVVPDERHTDPQQLEDLRVVLTGLLPENEWGEEGAMERANALRFIQVPDYRKLESWYGPLQHESVGPAVEKYNKRMAEQ